MRRFWILLLAVVMLAGTLSTSHAAGHSTDHNGDGHTAAVLDVPCRDTCQEDGGTTQPCCHEAVLHCAADAIGSAGQSPTSPSPFAATFHPQHTDRLRSPAPEAATPPPRV